MKIKNGFSRVVNHVKAHPAAYAYVAGATVAIVAYTVTMKIYFNSKKVVDLDLALKHMNDKELLGLSYRIDAENTLYLLKNLEKD